MAFYDLMFNQCRPAEAIERYAGEVYIQHNPHVADGKQAFVEYFERMARSIPASRSSSSGRSPRATMSCCIATRLAWRPDWAGIDIFRLDENGQVVEHWDVLQVVPDDSENDNTMF